MKRKKIDEFVIEETNTKVVILGDVKTNGREYAEAILTPIKK